MDYTEILVGFKIEHFVNLAIEGVQFSSLLFLRSDPYYAGRMLHIKTTNAGREVSGPLFFFFFPEAKIIAYLMLTSKALIYLRHIQ